MSAAQKLSISDIAWNGLPGERDDQNWPMLAVCEADGDRADEQLLQPGSEAELAGTNDDDGCVGGFRKLAPGPGRIAGDRPEGPADSSAVQCVLKAFQNAGTLWLRRRRQARRPGHH
uniref:Uncharacterized protein n=1 Tax=Arthrobacter sp. 68b TaxID=311808 RepID=A0A0F7G2W8_9MICC|nr:hypothetical protein [Arthrobacter sp. 68b]